ncbi:Agmatine deiminase [Candidatus Xiphinematobacter sp. Idaho Grape]|uniref:agmatine deiminase family protein n=1 Tax=Candidatus Xiphinematobacter sp. Idaho Grape TaxID=1704307 RepID=UPI0007056BDA|nr:agmatine deiminase family protein [Candidatus Xiphinematobacter sp. Idaho Grape]ALJ56725.1 Agmatine deiminase [Candidatus Xiphinematobacter sp. Idaho Grape]
MRLPRNNTAEISTETPARLGYRMPAEWELHEATWVSWPHPKGSSFATCYREILPTFVQMVEVLSTSEVVRINVSELEQEKQIRSLLNSTVPPERVEFFHIPTNEPWCRDYGPIFVRRNRSPQLAVVNFGYNAWGGKYPPYDADNSVPVRVSEELNLPIFGRPDLILEGGSIDTNGAGALLTTESCLLDSHRNPGWTRSKIEEALRSSLSVSKVLWLGEGIAGDDTDGHVDNIARFVAEDTVLTVIERNEKDPNFKPLQENLRRIQETKLSNDRCLNVITLPMPGPFLAMGERLPVSYANFFIGNEIILLPTFADIHDSQALFVLQEMFPSRKVVPINCCKLIWGLGALHCLTQQQPTSEKLPDERRLMGRRSP